MELLRSRRNERPVREEVLGDPAAGVRDFAERALGNQPLAVAMLKGALEGKASEQARAIWTGFASVSWLTGASQGLDRVEG